MAHSVSRFTIVVGLLASAMLALTSTPAEAKKKAAPAASSSSSTPVDDEVPGEKKAPAAAQAGDVERPKPIVDDAIAPESGPRADDRGNVTFTGGKSGKGKITVQAPPKEKVKVYLEGRYFGIAPRTINKIPPGDYIVEVVFPNGKSLSKPVSVAGEEEATVTVGAADALPVAPAEKGMDTDKAQRRWGLAKMVGAGAIGAVVVGLGLGVWEYTIQKDHDDKLKQPLDVNDRNMVAARESQIRSLENKGNTIATAANIMYVVGGVALVTAVFIGYPAYKALNAEKKPTSPEGTNMSFMILPNATLTGGTAGMALQF
jgi:hypothetical protein